MLRRVALVLSELITNSQAAIRVISWSGDIPPIQLWLRGDSARVRTIVADAVTEVPMPRTAGLDDENGRGLTIVAALSADWGHYEPVIRQLPAGWKRQRTWGQTGD